MNTLIEPSEFRQRHAAHVAGDDPGVMSENLEHLSRVMKLLPKVACGLEIGCFKGGTSVWLLDHGIETLHVIDTFRGSLEHGHLDLTNLEREFTENMAKFWTRMSVFKGESLRILMCLVSAEARYDFIYVDASHDSRDVITDAILAFRLLKQGGVMVLDDYLWNYHDDAYRNPKPAIDFFLGAFANELRVIEIGYQVSIQKL